MADMPTPPPQSAKPASKLLAGNRKYYLAGAAAVGGFALYKRSQNAAANSSTASTAATSTTPSTYDSSGLDAYNDLESQVEALAGNVATLANTDSSATASQAAGSVGASSTATTGTPSAGPVPKSAAPVANAYAVGTKVASGESIIQSIWDPTVGGWLDLTSKGGIYGSGADVSGSAYSPSWTGGGSLQLADNGTKVAELNAKGQQVGIYSVGK